jgi:GTP cyclohydrolase II
VSTILKPRIRQLVRLPLEDGRLEGDFVTFEDLGDEDEHIAIGLGDWRGKATPLVRVHSECLTGDVFGSQKCDCGKQLHEALGMLSKEGGILLYMRQEGRGIGLYNKIDAYALQARGYDTFEANRLLNFPDDLREFAPAARMLEALGMRKVRLLTNNPEKARQLAAEGIDVVEQIATGVFANEHNRHYLETKSKAGHKIDWKMP